MSTEINELSAFAAYDMTIGYRIDERKTVGLWMIPSSMKDRCVPHRETINNEPVMRPLYQVFKTDFSAVEIQSLVQVKVAGDGNPIGFSAGETMKNSETVNNLKYAGQAVSSEGRKTTVVTEMADGRGLHAFHHLSFWEDQPFIEIRTEVENRSGGPLQLEMIAGFCLDGLSPFQPDDGIGKYRIHRFRSMWSAEGRHEMLRAEELNLERSWNSFAPRTCRFGQVGSMPVRGWFPFAAFEDVESGVLWGVQLSEPGSWQLEISRRSDWFSLSGGLADREFGHWMKTLQPGECFTTQPAVLSCCAGDVDTLTNRMMRRQELNTGLLVSEQKLPVIFNDWCTTWGHPSEANMTAIADRLTGMGVEYLVMDDGWFNDTPGCQIGIGDWNISSAIYPSGFANLADALRKKGFIPGVWFEFENATRGSRIFDRADLFLHRDGHLITNGTRRFLDFRNPEVHDYLAIKVIRMLKENGIGYMKVDCNDTIGVGVDGAESPGEGLRQHLNGVQAFLKRVRVELPDLVLEICSSGGHRLEPSWMELADMGGFSDSHEGQDIPLIAANTQRMIPMRKNQVWAVLRKGDSPARLHYSLSAAFLGRMCLSGDIHELNGTQIKIVGDALSFYRTVTGSIRQGNSFRFGEEPLSYLKPVGWQAFLRVNENRREAFCVIHSFAETPAAISVPINGNWQVAGEFKQPHIHVETDGQSLHVSGLEPFNGLVVRLAQREAT